MSLLRGTAASVEPMRGDRALPTAPVSTGPGVDLLTLVTGGAVASTVICSRPGAGDEGRWMDVPGWVWLLTVVGIVVLLVFDLVPPRGVGRGRPRLEGRGTRDEG
jgi:hypothetical protein